MENEGPTGSSVHHFERVFLGNEMEIGQLGTFSKISVMTLAVAKDSGWFEVDLTMGEHYDWGKNKGCDFLSSSCSKDTISEFCSTVGEYGCNDDHVFRTLCSSNTFNPSCPLDFYMESCKVEKVSTDPEFTYGRESICLKRTVFSGNFNNLRM